MLNVNYRKFLATEENLWKAFWLCGILYLYALGSLTNLFGYALPHSDLLLKICGLLLVFVCTPLIAFSTWRNRKNRNNRIVNFLKKIRKVWNGEERLWKVFWLWGVLLYALSNLIGFLSIALPYVRLLIGIFGVILVFLYPVILTVSMFRCRKNSNYQSFKIFAICSLIPFLYFHVNWSSVLLLASFVYITGYSQY